jgi:cobalt/nickel transport system ATP-binding protein
VSTPVVEVKDLSFAYPDGTEALRDICLHIHPGDHVALLGPNGAGKTTLMLHLNGILTARRGSVTVSGMPVSEGNLLEIRRRVGIVFQDPDDQLFMPTVWEDVAFGPRILGLEGDVLAAKVQQALAAVDVEDLSDRPPNHLSHGQKRRVAIAGVLAMDPQILILDEPTSNLDPASRRDLTRVLGSLTVTQLIVTHDLLYAYEVCERCIIIDEGSVVADGPTAEVLGDEELLAAHRLALPAGIQVRDLRWRPVRAGNSSEKKAS